MPRPWRGASGIFARICKRSSAKRPPRNRPCANARPRWDARWPTCATGRKRSAHARNGPRTPPPTCSAAPPPKRWTAPRRVCIKAVPPRPSRPSARRPIKPSKAPVRPKIWPPPSEPTARRAAAEPASDGLAAAQAAVRAASQHLSQARAPAHVADRSLASDTGGGRRDAQGRAGPARHESIRLVGSSIARDSATSRERTAWDARRQGRPRPRRTQGRGACQDGTHLGRAPRPPANRDPSDVSRSIP